MEKGWHDERVPAPGACVLRLLLEKHAATQPGKVFARFADGSEWTYAQTLENVRQTAAGFQALGVRQGENVHTWLPNGPDAIRVWFALNYIGAIYVPLNVSYRGRILEHAIRLSGARLMVAHAALTDRLAEIDCPNLTNLVSIGSADVRVPGLAVHPSSVLNPATFELEPSDQSQFHTDNLLKPPFCGVWFASKA